MNQLEKTRILVVGATGRVGREVVSQLCGREVRVRALVRRPEAAGLPECVATMRGDLTEPESLGTCLEGVDAVFLVWTAPASAAGPALERILRRARRVVYLSAPVKTPHPLFQQPNASRDLALRIEGEIEAAGCEWTFLRPGMFAANAKGWWGVRIRTGCESVRWPYAEVETAPIHEADIAAVAVRALCDPGHAGAEYVLTGPEALTQRAQAEAIGAAVGRRIRMEEISREEALREWSGWMPEAAGKMLLDAWGAAAGWPAVVTRTVQAVTGVRARGFQEWARENADWFRG
jgi:uncharacterized protein YbjT (DUF2867 family)